VGEQESGQVAATAGVRLTDRIGIGVLTSLLPGDLTAEIPAETGRRESGPVFCLLIVLYAVMTMAVFRDGYEEVTRRLTGGLPFMRAWHKEWVIGATGAISQARDRLGVAPLKMLCPSGWRCHWPWRQRPVRGSQSAG
jgi:Insertion element 4 transposase N-terminal